MKQLLKICLGLFGMAIYLLALPAMAQRPEIRTVDKTAASTASLVTIKGDNFGTDATKIAVFFGASKGVVQSVSNQVLEVLVPPGATYDNISVVNTANGLIGYSKERFLLSYGGEHAISASDFELSSFNAQSIGATKDLYDICLCDFDGDGKSDVAGTGESANSIRIFQNQSTPGTVSFNLLSSTTLPVATPSGTIFIKCGDLNGDGKSDLVFSKYSGDQLFISKNLSTGTGNFAFSLPVSFALPNRQNRRIEIADLDQDGKPEIIVTDQGDVSRAITILVNQSTLSTLQFSSSFLTVTTGAVKTDGIDIQDLNEDGFPEIITSEYTTPSSKVYIVQNKSTEGNIQMGPTSTLSFPQTVNSTVNAVKFGDVDGDGRQDIITGHLLDAQDHISIFLNKSSGSTISFSPEQKIDAGSTASTEGDIGDLNGDGKADMVFSSAKNIQSYHKKITFFINSESTTPGNASFQAIVMDMPNSIRPVYIGDVDGDGKPDVVMGDIGNSTPKLIVLRNKHCFVPVATPAGPITQCAGTSLRLNSTQSNGVQTYTWKQGVTTVGGNSPVYNMASLNATHSGTYTITATSENGTCVTVSDPVSVNVGASVSPEIGATINPTGPICKDNPLVLTAIGVTNATSYRWSGPDGFTSTNVNPSVTTSFQTQHVGKYTVELLAGGCVYQTLSQVIELVDIGSFKISTASNLLCQGDSKTLTLSRNVAGASYQWYKDNVATGTNATSLTISAGGSYYCDITYTGCLGNPTDIVTIKEVSLPVPKFTAPATACAGQLIQFTNQSEYDNSVQPEYLWTFGDGNISSDAEPKHSYGTAVPRNVKLRVAYTGDVCAVESAVQIITITSAPTLSIINQNSTYEICANAETALTLQVQVTGGTYTTSLWNTGEQTPSIEITEPGTYSVEVETPGCKLFASRVIQALATPSVYIVADPPKINEGSSSQLTAQGLIDYEWSPSTGLSGTSIANPVASPTVTTIYTVTGHGNNGCLGTATIELIVKGEAIVNKLSPKVFFSPNDDATNAQWGIENILDFPQCGVAIYDDKGVKVYESKPYLNDWDGTFNGKRLPQGVYFYIIRCDGEESTPKAGSITILR